MTPVEVRRADPPADELALVRGLLSALAAFRWAAWVWMAVIAAIDLRNGPVAHPAAMVALVAVALVVTTVDTVLVRARPAVLLRWPMLLAELAVGLALVGLDHWVYGADSSHAQSLGTVWPLAGVLSIGVRAGGWGGVAAGLAVGTAAWLGQVLVVPGRWYGDRILGSLGTVVLYALGGAVGGLTAARLREARREIGMARAREEVARTLHDGVLQTLAVVQRRSDDPELVRLARDQEVELRQFLYGTAPETASRRARGASDLVAALREAGARAERTHGLRVEVAAAPDLPPVDAAVVAAVAGAAAEAMANAAKHGDATKVTVFVDVEPGGEPGEEATVACSVKDDGRGFEPADHVEGIGLRSSVRGRMAEVGGRVEVDGRPGRGAEVRLWAPVGGAPTAAGSTGDGLVAVERGGR
jgi:signal transduction histidine kinase